MSDDGWRERRDGSFVRDQPARSLVELTGGHGRTYVVRRDATGQGWTLSGDGVEPFHSPWASGARSLADALATEVERLNHPGMIDALGLRPHEWRVDASTSVVTLRHVRRDDVTLRRIQERWRAYDGDELVAERALAQHAAEAWADWASSRVALDEGDVARLREDLAAYARDEGVALLLDDTEDWVALVDGQGRFVMADVHAGEATYVQAVEDGYVVRACRTVDLLDPSVPSPGAEFDGTVHATPREATADMCVRNGFAVGRTMGA